MLECFIYHECSDATVLCRLIYSCFWDLLIQKVFRNIILQHVCVFVYVCVVIVRVCQTCFVCCAKQFL